MKKSTLIISLAAAGLISLGGYSVFADNSDSSYGRGYGCGGYRQSGRDDYYCPGPGYRR